MKKNILNVLFVIILFQVDSILSDPAKSEAKNQCVEKSDFMDGDEIFFDEDNDFLNEVAFEMEDVKHDLHGISLYDKFYFFCILIKHFLVQVPQDIIKKYYIQAAVYLSLKKRSINEEK